MRLMITGTILLVFMLVSVQINAQLYSSLAFNGRNNYVEIPDDPLNRIGTGDFTFEAWIKGKERDQIEHPVIFSNRGANAFGGGILFFLHAAWGDSNVKMLSIQFEAYNLLIINNGTFNGSLLDNNCHHIAITRKGELISFYADGVLFGTRTRSDIASVNLDGPLWIGQDRATNNTFDGAISQCRIWNVARSEEELFNNKDLSLEGDEPGLLAYWEMNDGEGQILKDKTNSYDGVLGADSQAPTWSDDYCIEAYEPPVPPLVICPNPTLDLITIKNPSGNNIPIRLFDALGRLILIDEITGELDQLDFSAYAGGVYFLQFPYEGKTVNEKIVKQ